MCIKSMVGQQLKALVHVHQVHGRATTEGISTCASKPLHISLALTVLADISNAEKLK